MAVTTSAPSAPATVCPRCGATLRPEDAQQLPGPPGYLPGLRWSHRDPRNGRTCHMNSGPPVGDNPPPAPDRGGGKIPA